MIQHSIVIGALNEEARLPSTLRKLVAFLKKNKLDDSTEIIIVAAKGKDKTAMAARSALKNYKHSKVMEPSHPVGKGRDIRVGMLEASGKIRLFMDADLATPLKHIIDAFTILDNEDADIVIGTRDIRKMHSLLSRRLVSLAGNLCFGVISGFYLPDTQCGFKAFNANSTKICFQRMTRLQWSFDMELLLIARLNQLSIAQLPISDWQDVPGGTFKSSAKHTLSFGKDMAVLLFNRLTGRYTK